jgi:hypothetical protein
MKPSPPSAHLSGLLRGTALVLMATPDGRSKIEKLLEA